MVFLNFIKSLNNNADNAISINGCANINIEFIKNRKALTPLSYLNERYIFSKQFPNSLKALITLGIKITIAITPKILPIPLYLIKIYLIHFYLYCFENQHLYLKINYSHHYHLNVENHQ